MDNQRRTMFRLCTRRLMYLFFKILGVLPFSIQLSGDGSTNDAAVSFLGLVYNGLLISATVVLSCPAVEAFAGSKFEYNTGTVVTIGLTRAVSGTVVTLVIWSVVALRQGKAAQIVRRMSAIDAMLTSLGQTHPPSLFARFKVDGIVGANVLIWINVFWLDLVVFDFFVKSTFVISVVPNLVFSWFLIQYSLLLISIETRFQTINRGIKLLSRKCWAVSEDRSSLSKNLHDMISFHGMLYDISSDVASFYSFPVLLIVTVSCGGILTTSYYLIIPFLADTREVSTLGIMNSLAYLAMEVFPIGVLTTSVTRLCQEMKFTTGAVHKLLAEDIPDRKLQSELKIFSLGLLHRRLEFTCCGIFSLDSTLLHSLANMTATYLVILVQFQTNIKTTAATITTDRSSLTNCASSEHVNYKN